MNKPHLLTFSSTGYTLPERFIRQAHQSEFFGSVSLYSNKQIEHLLKTRPLFFKVWKKRGFGFWIWKPRIILQRLMEIPKNDYLIYLDQGFHIQGSGVHRLEKYLNDLEIHRSWIGVFSAGENYRPEFFVRKQVVNSYNPGFYTSNFGEYVYAGILIIKNVDRAKEAIREWQKMCEETPFLAPLPIRLGQRREFIGQDGDNGYLPVVLDKWGGFHKFPPDEINLLNHEGFQLQHVIPSDDHRNIDWSQMKDRPFLLKRDR